MNKIDLNTYLYFLFSRFNLFNHQSSSCVSRATPLLIQCFCSWEEGKRMYITKLVEWPVVLSTPRRADVLYTGHL